MHRRSRRATRFPKASTWSRPRSRPATTMQLPRRPSPRVSRSSSSDDEHDAIEAIRALEPNAKSAEVTIALGAGLAPGLADVLVAHAGEMFRAGRRHPRRPGRLGGAGSVATVRHERRASVRSWHDGGWREEHPHGETLVWFPEPIGGRDCSLVTGSGALLVDAFPNAPRIRVQRRRTAEAHLVAPPLRRRRRVGRGASRGVGPEGRRSSAASSTESSSAPRSRRARCSRWSPRNSAVDSVRVSTNPACTDSVRWSSPSRSSPSSRSVACAPRSSKASRSANACVRGAGGSSRLSPASRRTSLPGARAFSAFFAFSIRYSTA